MLVSVIEIRVSLPNTADQIIYGIVMIISEFTHGNS